MKTPKKITLLDKTTESVLRTIIEDIYINLTSQKEEISNLQNADYDGIRGDIGVYDWTQATLTLDGTWQTLDCSSIVPEGARTIFFRVNVSDNSTGLMFGLRPKGRTNTIVADWLITQVTNIEVRTVMRIPCDEGRRVEYWGSNTTWTLVEVAIVGWSF